jgi:hypothetical protein
MGAIGGTTAVRGDDPAAWFIAAAAALATALIWVLLPERQKVPLWISFGWWRYRRKLSADAKPGWKASAVAGRGGTELMLTSERGTKPLPGFYCEVQGPTGVWEATTGDAAPPPAGARRTSHFDLPSEKASAFFRFSDEFDPPEGTRKSRAKLPHGRYYVLWWAWKQAPDGLSVKLDFVTCGWFAWGLAGGKHGEAKRDLRSGGCPPQD